MKKSELAQYAGLVRQSDLSREITLRNANAHRRLEGELKHLDEQLHQRLVTVQADIADLKLSHYSSGTRRCKSPARSPVQGRKLCRTADISNSSSARQVLNQYRLLPEINVQTEITTESKPLQQIPKNEASSSTMLGKDIQATSHTFYSLKGQSRPSTSTIMSRRGKDAFVGRTKNSKSSLAVSSNICRPSSSPDLRSCSGTDIRGSPSLARRTLPPLERSNRETQPQSNSDLLSERVKDFIKRPNSNSGERKSISKNGSNLSSLRTSVEKMQTPSDVNSVNDTTSQTNKKENEQEHFTEGESDGDKTSDDQKDKEKQLYSSEDDLFLTSNLLKAHSDSPLSASMPDLSTFGFMDYNEVIDKRLRDLQEWQHNPPTEEEMRKVKYLRFRDVHQTPDILSVFDKPE